jgi:dUTP pyrophosphatase
MARLHRPNTVVFCKISPDAKSPTKAHNSDHCWDLYATERRVIRNGESEVVPLGIKVALPDGYALILKERSGLASKGVIIGGGVIDSGYRGELKAIVRYLNWPDAQASSFVINVGDKIAQAKLERTIDLPFQEVPVEEFDELPSDRGTAGFGSTGV